MKILLIKYLQSTLTPDEFDLFCDYINRPENTSSISETMKSEWSNFLAHDDFKRENPSLFNKLQNAILAKENVEAKQKLRLYEIRFRVAAVLLVGIIISGAWFFQHTRSSLNEIPVQTVSIPNGAQTQFRTPDGSLVWLNAGSRLTFSNDFSKRREVNLKGEAYFDVVKEKIPFEVNTKYGTVRVLGTAFNVQAYSGENFVTTLERGMVTVTDNDNKEEIVIKPGEQALSFGGHLLKKNVDTELFTSWKDGRLIFSREPFPSMIKRLEHWFNVEIEFNVNDFKGLWFSGTIEGETVTDVMKMICIAAPVNYSYNAQKRVIKISSK